ncbi:hypothetical protein T439DRAFT_380234 [Meredithblackwellia eburnea MCA 4105]
MSNRFEKKKGEGYSDLCAQPRCGLHRNVHYTDATSHKVCPGSLLPPGDGPPDWLDSLTADTDNGQQQVTVCNQCKEPWDIHRRSNQITVLCPPACSGCSYPVYMHEGWETKGRGTRHLTICEQHAENLRKLKLMEEDVQKLIASRQGNQANNESQDFQTCKQQNDERATPAERIPDHASTSLKRAKSSPSPPAGHDSKRSKREHQLGRVARSSLRSRQVLLAARERGQAAECYDSDNYDHVGTQTDSEDGYYYH